MTSAYLAEGDSMIRLWVSRSKAHTLLSSFQEGSCEQACRVSGCKISLQCCTLGAMSKTRVFSLPIPFLVMEGAGRCWYEDNCEFRRGVGEPKFLDLLCAVACSRLARAQSSGLMLVNSLHQETSPSFLPAVAL